MTVRWDTVAPYLSITAPAPLALVAPGTVSVMGSVFDALSPPVVTCDGVAATVVDGSFACAVEVPSGGATVDVAARDAAGNIAHTTVTVHTTAAMGVEPTSLRVTPRHVRLTTGQTQRFTVVDNLGRVPADAVWTLDTANVATLATANGPELTGVSAGAAVVTATWRGLSASTEVTILGTAAAAGAVLWTAPPLVVGVEDTFVDSIAQGAVTLDGRRQVYVAELAAESGTSIIRAFDVDGREQWAHAVSGRVLQLSGDPGGGVVALYTVSGEVVGGQSFPLNPVIALTPDGRGTVVATAASSEFAITPEGVLYVATRTALVGINIGFGGGRTVTYPTGAGTPTQPGITTVLDDGTVVLPLNVDTGPAFWSQDDSIQLLVSPPVGNSLLRQVFQTSPGWSGGSAQTLTPYKSIPNGLGGVLVAYDWSYSSGSSFYLKAAVVGLNSAGAITGTMTLNGHWQLTDVFTSKGGDLVLGGTSAEGCG